MPLARLENLLKNLNGNIIYVDPGQLDSTDSIENKGNSAIRPFKTIQRALLEAVRFSYVQGPNNDIFDQTTILISPGTHYIDNRPGIYLDGNTAKTYSGSETTIPELDLQSVMDLTDPQNVLYKFNSADGGVIIPRGVSIVATDLRKTKIRPKYVPAPSDNLVERTSIFRLTGSCYIFGFSIFDGDPNGNVYTGPTSTFQTAPRYSHHKLTAFEYVDGKNKYVKNGVTLDKSDLEMYYYKVAKAYGQNSGIPTIIDWGVNNPPDLYPNLEENRIVGDLGSGTRTISSIYAGDGINEISNIVTVTTTSEHNLSPNTAILISDVGGDQEERAEYNGSFTVSQVISPTQFTYRLVENPQSTVTPSIVGRNPRVTTVSDTVSSSSPYVFNCSLKSVYGMNGLHADGEKATGFKSIVTAQFTGISLQKDDNAFVLYNESTGTYNDQSSYSDRFLHQDSRAVYKPDWESFHIKASNDAFIQCVSIFAIGYSKHFVADNGGDQSITNSNSNFGSVALSSRGFKDYELEKDNHAFITHIIPPKEIRGTETEIRCLQLDSSKTADNTRVYLKGYTSILDVPPINFRGFTIGGRNGENIYFESQGTTFSATVSPNYKLDVLISSIDDSTNTITLSQNLTVGSPTGINTSQAVKIISNNGILPDGIEPHKIYYVNKSVTTNTLQLSESVASSELDAYIEGGIPVNIININTVGAISGNLRLVSKVSDRLAGDVASPIAFDATNGWYIRIASNPSFITALSSAGNPIIYIKRVVDNRNTEDKLYRARLVIPKDSLNASEPTSGFILQKSSTAISSLFTQQSDSIELDSLSNSRNTNQIVDAWYSSGVAHIITKYPHNLTSGNLIKINSLKSSNEPNPIGLGTGTGYNGKFEVSSVVDDLHFTYNIPINPGTITTIPVSASNTWMNTKNCGSSSYRVPPYTITSDNSVRANLPYFTCEEVTNEFQLYKIDTIQKYSPKVSDGVYYVTLNAFKNTPLVSPFNIDDLRLSQSIEDLYPTTDQDNLVSDPYPTKSVASRKTIGKVDVNDKEYSVTKETTVQFLKDFGTGVEISTISKSGDICTITTSKNHSLSGISQLTGSGGSGFVNGTWYDIPLCGGSGENATATIVVSGGAVTQVKISYPGSGYVLGDVVTVRGIPHSSSNGASINLTVASIFAVTNKCIQLIGCQNTSNDGIFPIISATRNTITYTNSNGENEVPSLGLVVFTNDAISISSAVLSSGNTTITTSSNHGIAVGNKVYFSGIPSTTFNVISVASSTVFTVSGNASSSGSSVFCVGLSPSLRNSNSSNENLLARQYPLIGEHFTTTTAEISFDATQFNLANSRAFKKSDFIQVNDEIMMISKVVNNSITVKRALFNTKKPSSHITSSIVKKIKPVPIELRRNSILRASGHTFEYLGFGPGNYSTGMPTNQDRILNDNEVLISQALASRGGSVLYTGMNSNGDFYIGRKKYNTLTGQESLTGVSEVENDTNFADDFTINNLVVITELDASTADSTFGDVTIEGNLTVNRPSTFGGDITVSSGSLKFTGTSSVFDGDIYSTGGSDGDFAIFNTTNSGSTQFYNKDSSGNYNIILELDNNSAIIDGTLTAGNTTINGIATATTFVGNGITPINGIIMWNGTIAEAIALEPGWALCDGRTVNGKTTPDLRDRFIIGATNGGDNIYPGVGVGQSGGTADAVVVSHTHTATSSAAPHSHTMSYQQKQVEDTGSAPVSDMRYGNDGDGGAIDYSNQPGNIDAASITVSTSISTEGESGTNKNLPPYYALAFIMRVS